MPTGERECLDALRNAADALGESPSKAQYEALGTTPAASTILRVIGGWNEAKERAGLETNPSTGARVAPKPDDVSIPDDEDGDDLTQDQRWHYRHAEWNTRRTLARRAGLRSWVNKRKAARGCADCGGDDPACLDCHHPDRDEKEMAVTGMVTHGYSRERLAEAIDDCEILCANCHQKQHGRRPAVVDADDSLTKHERLQKWAYEYRKERGCQRCSEADPDCLQFHHSDPEGKEASVSEMIGRSYTEDEIRSEVAGCLVLCANCHRREHFELPDGETGAE